ncbi:MAG: hypothetical protein HY568_05195 [Candidatus Latescibacteria bacterium]|nr:hypothetical protein [Candidatus Latescibacterota bacterium]
MTVVIREVASGKDLERFIRFPFDLYRGSDCWVPPLVFDERNTLRRDKNPAFDFCEAKYWIAYDGGRVVGRVAGIINKTFVEKWGHRYARFGWIDFVDDMDVSGALLGAVESWAAARGMDAVHGPLGFTDLDREGMLVEGFGELGTMATMYNHPYYPAHLERHGYSKDVDWVEFEVKVPAEIPERTVQIGRRILERRKLRILEARKAKEILPYARGIFEVVNAAYAKLYGFVPLTERQIEFYTKQYFPSIVPDYVKILLDADDHPAGFVIGMPSLSRALQKAQGRLFPFGIFHLLGALRRPRQIDLLIGAIRPDLQGSGADALLITEIGATAIRNRIVSAETNPELESNLLVQAHWKHFESRQHKRRRCYIKRLNGAGPAAA